MKKLILPFFLVLATAAGFTSCGDDDEEEKHAKITMTIDGSEVKSGEAVTLAKTTVDSLSNETDVITLKVNSDYEISGLQVFVNNKWEKNVDIVTTDTISFNRFYKENTPSKEKEIKFTGVIGEYTVKVKTSVSTETLKFKVRDTNKNSEYTGAYRTLSNKQIIIYDASAKSHEKTILGVTFVNDMKNSNSCYLNGNIIEITEKDYLAYNKGLMRDFASEAENLKEWKTKWGIKVPAYFIYKNSDKYYLMKIISVNGDIMIAEIQY